MKILIIGGTGNISTAITRFLLARGEEVVHFNNDERTPEEFRGKVRTIHGDRTEHTTFETAMAAEGCFDCVIDMIGYEPEDARSDVRAFAGRTRQFIFCSTVDVYTKPAKRLPIREDEERRPSPTFAYAYKKALCEEILWEAHARGDFSLTVIRPAATYNDSSHPISLIGPGEAFLRRVRLGQPLIVLGDGQSIWVSTHRDDVGRAIANAVGNPKAYGRAYNVMGELLEAALAALPFDGVGGALWSRGCLSAHRSRMDGKVAGVSPGYFGCLPEGWIESIMIRLPRGEILVFIS
ncbi:MAG: NAD-dependent epimerase/dehydratase family protein [Firmicutes bacterium]|nr:NAD-dependent epimerase/dehydratase family protein [Bacillota bacterium]